MRKSLSTSLFLMLLLLRAPPATAVSIDGIRSEMIKAVDAIGAERCNLVGYDLADDYVHIFPNAERNYYRKVIWRGQEREYLVGHWGRGQHQVGDTTWRFRQFYTYQGHGIGTVLDGGLDWVSYATDRHGVMMTLNAYYTVDRYNRQVLDYNGHCASQPFAGLMQKQLYPQLIKCMTERWASYVAETLCSTRSDFIR